MLRKTSKKSISDEDIEKKVLSIIGSRAPDDVKCLQEMIMGREYFNRVFSAESNLDGHTIFHYAVIHASPEMVGYLLDNGAKVNVTDRHGFTPLIDAISRSQHVIIEMLLNRGADANVRALNTLTPLELAIRSIRDGLNIKYISKLLAAGASPLTRNYKGKTPYEQCIEKRDLEIKEAKESAKDGHFEREQFHLQISKKYDEAANLIAKYDISNVIQKVDELTAENKRLSEEMDLLKKQMAQMQVLLAGKLPENSVKDKNIDSSRNHSMKMY